MTTDDIAGADAEQAPEKQSRNLLERTLNQVVKMNSGVARAHIRRFGGDRSGHALQKRLDHQFRITMTGSSAAVGAAAAVPGVGTAASIVLAGGEVVATLEATMLYVLASAQAHGVEIEDVDQRRALLMAVMLGNSGRQVVETLIGDSGGDWGKTLALLPKTSLKTLNSQLRNRFLKRFGTQQGITALGRLAPFGIGAVLGGAAGIASSGSVIKATKKAFAG